MLDKLHNDSSARALQLNKAYRVIVQEQTFKVKKIRQLELVIDICHNKSLCDI